MVLIAVVVDGTIVAIVVGPLPKLDVGTTWVEKAGTVLGGLLMSGTKPFSIIF